jgi:hypothetical protein
MVHHQDVVVELSTHQQESAAELCLLPPTFLEEGSIQGLWGEEGCPQDGDGAPPRCGGGAEHPSAGCSA